MENLSDRSLLSSYFRNILWVICSVVTFTLLAFYYLKIVSPKYRVTAYANIFEADTAPNGMTNKLIGALNSDIVFEKSAAEVFAGVPRQQLRQELVTSDEGRSAGKIVMSLLATDTLAGKRFLDRLVRNYNLNPLLFPSSQAGKSARVTDSLRMITVELTKLRRLSSDLEEKFNASKLLSRARLVKSAGHEQDEVQRKLRDVFVSYLKHPVSQYSVLPYVDEVNDPKLKDAVNQFNTLQNEKQTKLPDIKNDDLQVKELDGRLTKLKKDILEIINVHPSSISQGGQGALSANLKYTSLKDSISNTALLIKAKDEQRMRMVALTGRRGPELVPAKLVFSKNPFTGSTPEFPQKGMTYIFAILVGLTLPVFIPLLSHRVKKWGGNDISIPAELKNLTTIPVYPVSMPSSKGVPEIDPALSSALANELPTNSKARVLLFTALKEQADHSGLLRRVAEQLSLRNGKSVLVDFNFKYPGLSQEFNMAELPGVADYVEKNNCSLDELLQVPEQFPNITVLGIGKSSLLEAVPINSFFASNQLASPWLDESKLDALINSPNVKKLISELKSRFNYILISAAAIDQPADFFPLVAISDLEVIVLSETNIDKGQIRLLQSLRKRQRFSHPVIFYEA